MSPSSFLRTALVLTAVASVAAADILTVGPAGSGAQFTQIQAAIDVAADDDVILVKAGVYDRIVVDKPLRILGDGTGNALVASSLVRDIEVGEEVVLSGLQLLDTLLQSPVAVRDCTGTVFLHDVFVNGTSFGPGVRVENCA